ncbi:hypothetical protein E4T56_gene565 [Termitomyces sp. T112]|nr:hypothetical protein E4T56_gene565 [Termitomyces sp. T112]
MQKDGSGYILYRTVLAQSPNPPVMQTLKDKSGMCPGLMTCLDIKVFQLLAGSPVHTFSYPSSLLSLLPRTFPLSSPLSPIPIHRQRLTSSLLQALSYLHHYIGVTIYRKEDRNLEQGGDCYGKGHGVSGVNVRCIALVGEEVGGDDDDDDWRYDAIYDHTHHLIPSDLRVDITPKFSLGEGRGVLRFVLDHTSTQFYTIVAVFKIAVSP